MQTIIILLLIGLGAGILSGVVGIGGGIVIVPALVFFFNFSQRMAQGTSLGILLLPVGLMAVIQFYKAGYVDVRFALIIAGAFFVGSFFGSKIALSVPQDVLKKCFATLLILVAIKMLFFDNTNNKKTNQHISTNNNLSS